MVLEPVQQRILCDELDLCMAKLARIGRFGRAAQLRGQRLHAVADAQDRHPGIENGLRRRRCAELGRRLGTARQDDALRGEARDLGRVVVPRPDFAIHADFADAARDELGVLRAEIQDQDLVAVQVGHGVPSTLKQAERALSPCGNSVVPW